MCFWYCDNCETIWHRDSADTCWICDGEPSPVADDFVYTSPSQGSHYPKPCTYGDDE